jgi:hypothetical protein
MAMNTRSRFLATPKKEKPKFLWLAFLTGRHVFLRGERSPPLEATREKQELLRNCGQIE